MPEAVHPIAKNHPAYTAAESRRALLRTMRGGQEGMWKAGQTYLPVLPGESASDPAEYPARLARSTFYPFVNEAAAFAVGQVFGKEIELAEDVPPALVDYCEDIDLRGNNLHVFAAATFLDYWWSGCGAWLVDMPPAPRDQGGNVLPMNANEAATAGRRPFWCRYDSQDIVDWRYSYRAGRRRLEMVKLQEVATLESGEYGEDKTEPRRRIIWAAPLDGRGRPIGFAQFEEWAQRKSTDLAQEEWAIVTERTPLDKMTEIPLVVLGELDGISPLQDLGYLNLAHWQMHSDLQNIEHVANVPIPYVAGGGEKFDGDGKRVALKWAVNTMLELAAGAEVGYFEHTGACIGELKKSLDKLESEMGRRAMRSILETKASGQVTATSDIITAGRTFSVLQLAALRLQDALELALAHTARYAGVSETGGSVEVNRRFMALPSDAQTLTFIQWMHERGMLSAESTFAEGRRREIVSDALTFEEEQERIATEGPKLGEIGADRALAARVVALVKGGMGPDEAMEMAEAERDGRGDGMRTGTSREEAA